MSLRLIRWSVFGIILVVMLGINMWLQSAIPFPSGPFMEFALRAVVSLGCGCVAGIVPVKIVKHMARRRAEQDPEVRPRYGSLEREDGSMVLLVFRASDTEPDVFIGLDAGTEEEVGMRPGDKLNVDALRLDQSVAFFAEGDGD